MYRAISDPCMNEVQLSGREPIPWQRLKKLGKTVTPAVCKIVSNSGSASGFLLAYKRGCTGEDDIYALVTNNHVISDITNDSLQSFIFEFQSVPNLKQFLLTPEIIFSPWSDNNLDATIIGIRQGMVARMMNEGARFIEMGTAMFGIMAAVIGHPEGDETSIDYGQIAEISDCQILHRSSTKPGSSGSPLVTMDGEVVGIHKGAYSNEFNRAVHLEFVFKRYILETNQTRTCQGIQ